MPAPRQWWVLAGLAFALLAGCKANNDAAAAKSSTDTAASAQAADVTLPDDVLATYFGAWTVLAINGREHTPGGITAQIGLSTIEIWSGCVPAMAGFRIEDGQWVGNAVSWWPRAVCDRGRFEDEELLRMHLHRLREAQYDAATGRLHLRGARLQLELARVDAQVLSYFDTQSTQSPVPALWQVKSVDGIAAPAQSQIGWLWMHEHVDVLAGCRRLRWVAGQMPDSAAAPAVAIDRVHRLTVDAPAQLPECTQAISAFEQALRTRMAEPLVQVNHDNAHITLLGEHGQIVLERSVASQGSLITALPDGVSHLDRLRARTWQLQKTDFDIEVRYSLLPTDALPKLQLREDGRFQVQGPCNTGDGRFHVDAQGNITLRLTDRSLNGCSPAARMDLDNQLLEALRSGYAGEHPSYPGQLLTMSRTGAILGFTPVSEP